MEQSTAKKVLIIDDDPVIRILIEDSLGALGFEVEALESGIKCLERITSDLPDILLLDFQMPVMNGLEVLKSIRGDSKLKSLPVIMLSANGDTQSIVENASVNADMYIVKPFEINEIAAAINSLC